ncbi:MAG: hypothetical protein P8Y02_12585 [Deinococcales bacterium]
MGGVAGTSNYRRALEFHLRIGDTPPLAPCRPDAETLALRLRLVREEAAEALHALEALAAEPGGDPVERQAAAAHELADLLYVVYGTFVALGVDADEVFAEIHAANLRKVGAPRRADGKQLRPDGWRPADVAGVLRRQDRDESQGRAIEEL